ncbi:GNAT family N-acetyltransferase [Sulfitobacter sp. PS-8MA]|uniref:GNAT family N-acetyltransferase n=1 Tax=Sulfitobacter sp. PS-8MA TaxID=3237707 RepID=UPI0034C6A437
MSRTIPTINTSRLTLRAMRAEDFPRFAEIWALPEVASRIFDGPRSKAQSWDAFLRNAGHWQITGFGQWAVQLHRQREVLGQTGFFFGSRNFDEEFDTYPEARLVLAPEAQDQRLGFEAARAAHEWFDRVITGRTVCMIAPGNIAALKIAGTLGYELLREAEVSGRPVRLLTRRGPPV